MCGGGGGTIHDAAKMVLLGSCIAVLSSHRLVNEAHLEILVQSTHLIQSSQDDPCLIDRKEGERDHIRGVTPHVSFPLDSEMCVAEVIIGATI